jgi:hypothetical protein
MSFMDLVSMLSLIVSTASFALSSVGRLGNTSVSLR